MYNDLRADQTIVVYNGSTIAYEGTVGDITFDEFSENDLANADYYLLHDVEDYEVLAIIN